MSQHRLLAIGDIHGCLTAFETLLLALQLHPTDQLVALGDYVDRGPDSRRVLDRVILLHELGRLIPLRGNHELMMLRAREDWRDEEFWRGHGGNEALASYAPLDRSGRLNDVPDRHWKFMAATCVNHYETERHIFVHAGVHPFFDLHCQTEEELFWRAITDRGQHKSGKTVICGHSMQRSGRPLNFGHTICIDTGVYSDGWLTALDVNSGKYWQANQKGEPRTGQL